MARPTRLYHLEDIIAREFTHFDGFSYIPNDEKKAEYPDDNPICSVFRNYCMLRTNRSYNTNTQSCWRENRVTIKVAWFERKGYRALTYPAAALPPLYGTSRDKRVSYETSKCELRVVNMFQHNTKIRVYGARASRQLLSNYPSCA